MKWSSPFHNLTSTDARPKNEMTNAFKLNLVLKESSKWKKYGCFSLVDVWFFLLKVEEICLLVWTDVTIFSHDQTSRRKS